MKVVLETLIEPIFVDIYKRIINQVKSIYILSLRVHPNLLHRSRGIIRVIVISRKNIVFSFFVMPLLRWHN